jgi:hypothetical protein
MDRAAVSFPLEASAEADGLRLPRILTPYDASEALPISTAAKRACVSSRTMRNWCGDHGLGRRIGGRWRVSCVALQMYLDGDKKALAAYLAGARAHCEAVAAYFRRCGISDLLKRPEFGAGGD